MRQERHVNVTEINLFCSSLKKMMKKFVAFFLVVYLVGIVLNMRWTSNLILVFIGFLCVISIGNTLKSYFIRCTSCGVAFFIDIIVHFLVFQTDPSYVGPGQHKKSLPNKSIIYAIDD